MSWRLSRYQALYQFDRRVVDPVELESKPPGYAWAHETLVDCCLTDDSKLRRPRCDRFGLHGSNQMAKTDCPLLFCFNKDDISLKTRSYQPLVAIDAKPLDQLGRPGQCLCEHLIRRGWANR